MLGRSAAFNATLFFTALFGLLSSWAYSFPSLCVLLFFLGSAVGVGNQLYLRNKPTNKPQGSMPTDGTLLLEHMPKEKQYLVTALSVFFSFGAVLSAVVAILVVPKNSCSAASAACDVATENQGWRYLLSALGIIVRRSYLTPSPPNGAHIPSQHIYCTSPSFPSHLNSNRRYQCSSHALSSFACTSPLVISCTQVVRKRQSSHSK